MANEFHRTNGLHLPSDETVEELLSERRVHGEIHNEFSVFHRTGDLIGPHFCVSFGIISFSFSMPRNLFCVAGAGIYYFL